MPRVKGDPENEERITQALAALEKEEDKPVFDKGAWNPCKFTANNIAIILNRLLNGQPLSLALAEARITRKTYDSWCEKCEAGNKRYANFTEIVEIARLQGVARLHNRLLALAEDDGKIMLEVLRALEPNIYSEKKVISNLHQGTVKIEYVDVGGREDAVSP